MTKIIGNTYYFFKKGFMKRPLTVILLILLVIYLFCMLVVIIFEGEDFVHASLMVIPAFLGELGIVESNSLITPFSIITALVVSIGFLSIFTAKITSFFIEFCRVGGSVMKNVNFSDHIIICSWNFQGERIINELLSADSKHPPKIVILADL